MRKCKHSALLIMLVGLTAGLFSCEDDPILDQGPSKSAGGSYGRLGLPDSTGKYAPPSVTNKNNPSIF